MEVKLRNRSRLMLAVWLAAFLLLVYAYAQIEMRLPQGYTAKTVVSRGSILAQDGTVLAKTVGQKRMYPQGQLAGQLLGMVGTDRGLEGLEASFEDRLARGEDITLTIDPRLQAVAESVLARAVKDRQGKYGSVVALDVKSGRILAAASYPPFDPNNWRNFPAADRRNRPLVDVYEPGSPIKALIIGAAINDGLTTPGTGYSTPMRRRIGRNTINDAVAHPPTLSTKEVLRYSSNVGMSHIVEHFTPNEMYAYLTAYGFGQKVGMKNVYTETGLLQPWQRWNDIVRVNTSFGQGMSGTTLQLAAAYNALANGGQYLPPRLVSDEPTGEPRQVLRPETAETMRTLLTSVVQEGIPHAAGIPGYQLAGKTGTAQVAENGRYSSTLYNSVFAGFFPAEAPRVTLAVMVHGATHDYHGSQLAAPIYRDIATEVFSQWAYPPVKSE
ncbi:peptidoglycan D,D-transpeptidase FtsI family protein [Deinococcus peraridilitoris]|uniref:Cell division protein FtsI/penicillin-binding protein 2 n=1 Tax=Deinococcus peraridilitoris (strain DSM 19664 / LMG 22246 / CIP 109416 / KR-200) TaxID=937777 RepID=L0A6F4_DEIPD|nr:penicillin-binding protein 2 [Deinococcus peraridilitoris]AFZ68757.1 cell division protein FtsI/penicillin-binding protein 2 [Deinococcus peraridilitoris DSM 19664]